MKKITLSLSTVLLLSNCTLAPSYTRPELPVQNHWATETAQDKQGKNSSDIRWKEFFKSPELQAVIQAALENNRDLRVALLNVKAARALYRVERANLMPDVRVGATHIQQNLTESQNGVSTLNDQYEANVASTAFELDLFGRLQSESDAALETYFATKSAQETAQITLIAETANAYLQWLSDRKILKLTEETLTTQEKSYSLITANYNSGVASKLDLVRVQTAVETARSNQAIYIRRVELDKNALQLLIGKQDNGLFPKGETLDDVVVMKNLPVGLPSAVLLSRPDIQQAEYQLKSANANIGAARAAFFPTISLTGSYGFASNNLSDLFSGSAAGAWSFIPKATIPVFEGGRNLANLSFSKVNKEIAVARYEQSIQVAFREINDELITRKTLSNQLIAQHNIAQANRKAYDLSYARYKQGVDSFLSVLDAQRSLYSAQQAEIEVQKQQLSNLVNLYKVLGGS